MIKMLSAPEFENAASRNQAEPVAIWKERKFIEEYSSEELSLTKVAKAVGMNANYLSENFRQLSGINFVELSRALASSPRVIFCEIQICTSVKLRSQRGVKRSHNSIAFLKSFWANPRRNIVRRRASPVGVGRIPIAWSEKIRRNALSGFSVSAHTRHPCGIRA